ncbi:hypothetical protein A1O3_02645 [Capronia epimyces CBS 606.96]|uniref:Zn(2)-C6 fungal-type domain-containing protein n=1 Tax=Capronia epimyces CBS 606.96 TaxID=1182542 RepID=W9YAN0_9EURO|nr:uncharacterized protein A1O3_02645 [Capronia epimyces CBS 606.96]EXJ89578.1 hypothetical protein A1O3_02645 [Capronia epimyces CBS 606.96]
MQACDRCNRRKSRCSGDRPCCRQCQKSKNTCVYTDRARNAAILAERLATLESKLKESEAARETLAAQLAQAQSQARGAATAPTTATTTAATTGVAADRPSRADIVNEVSFFASTAAGDRHYLGSTSGVLFAHLVLPEAEESIVETCPTAVPEACSRDNSSNTYADVGPKCASSETLPADVLARKLVGAYLGHDHLRYPFLEPAFLRSTLEKIYTERAFDRVSAFEWFAFDMVLGIAKLHEYKSDWQQTPPSAATHHIKAMFHIKEVLRSGGLQSLQAILLLIQYRTSSPVQDTSASLWHLVGIATRMVYELGLHREASYHTVSSTMPRTRQAHQQHAIRRLCFWCVFALDRVVSITLGRPLAMNADDFDVHLPSLSTTTTETAADAGESYEAQDPAQAESSLPIFVHFVQHMNICGNVMRLLHGVKPIQSDDTVLTLRNHLMADLDQWRQSTAELTHFWRNSDAGETSSSCFRCREWYEVLYHNAILLALRPSPTGSEALQDSSTLQRIFDSSKQAVRLYAHLYESRRLNYSWITLHSVFMAGLSYIYAVAHHFQARRNKPGNFGNLLSHDPTVVEIATDTRACSNILVAVSERWNLTKRCHKVFDQLSDAILAEAVKPSRQCGSKQAADHVDVINNDAAGPPLQDGHNEDLARYQSQSMPLVGNGWHHQWFTSDMSGDSMAASSNNMFNSQPPTLDMDLEFRNCFGDLLNSYTAYPFISELDFQSLHGWPATASGWF